MEHRGTKVYLMGLGMWWWWSWWRGWGCTWYLYQRSVQACLTLDCTGWSEPEKESWWCKLLSRKPLLSFPCRSLLPPLSAPLLFCWPISNFQPKFILISFLTPVKVFCHILKLITRYLHFQSSEEGQGENAGTNPHNQLFGDLWCSTPSSRQINTLCKP